MMTTVEELPLRQRGCFLLTREHRQTNVVGMLTLRLPYHHKTFTYHSTSARALRSKRWRNLWQTHTWIRRPAFPGQWSFAQAIGCSTRQVVWPGRGVHRRMWKGGRRLPPLRLADQMSVLAPWKKFTIHTFSLPLSSSWTWRFNTEV
jgi:hypothetical protein